MGCSLVLDQKPDSSLPREPGKLTGKTLQGQWKIQLRIPKCQITATPSDTRVPPRIHNSPAASRHLPILPRAFAAEEPHSTELP